LKGAAQRRRGHVPELLQLARGRLPLREGATVEAIEEVAQALRLDRHGGL
jgi:hypothetical protein